MTPPEQEPIPGQDVFGAPWPEDPRLQAEPDSEPEEDQTRLPTGVGGDAAASPSTRKGDGDSGSDYDPARSSVKLTKNTRGVNWDVKVMVGDTEAMLDEARRIAVAQHRALELALAAGKG